MLFMRRISTPDASETVEEANRHQQQPTRNCQVKEHCKKNRSVGRCHKCRKSMEKVLQAQTTCAQAVGLVDDKELG